MTEARVAWICPHLAHYHRSFFVYLMEQSSIRIEVAYSRLPSAEAATWIEKYRGPNQLFFRTTTSYQLCQWIDETLSLDRGTVFVVNGWGSTMCAAALLALRLRGARYWIWTDTPTNRRQRKPWSTLARKVWVPWITKKSEGVLATGQVGVETTIHDADICADQVKNLPFYVDLSRFRPREESDHRKNVVLCSAGRFVHRKGYDVALRAVAAHAEGQELRDRGICYRLAGEGPEKEKLKKLAEELGIGAIVEFCGWLSPSKLPRFYRAGDVFLHPARWDPFPNAVLEAMASGLPVIGTSSSGSVVDRVKGTVGGYVVRPDDHNALANAIDTLLRERSSMSQRRREARKVAERWPYARGLATIQELIT